MTMDNLESTLNDASLRSTFKWHVDFFDGRRVRGWVGCKADPNVPTHIVFWRGRDVLATTIANAPRADVSALGFGPTGFSCTFPERVTDPVVFAATIPSVQGWVILESKLVAGVGLGHIDILRLDCIKGWVIPFGAESKEDIEVGLWQGPDRIAAAPARNERPDVASAYQLDNPFVGFDLRVPFSRTAFNSGLFTLRALIGNRTLDIRKDLKFLDCKPAFERSIEFDVTSLSWDRC